MRAELTIGDALRAAVAEVDRAIERRNELVRYAVSRGATYRSVAEHVGAAASTVHRWALSDGRAAAPFEFAPLDLPAPAREEDR